MTSARRLVVPLAALAALLCTAVAALALPPFTTAPKSAPPGPGLQAEVSGMVTGCHPTFDRLVLRTRLTTPGYDVRYGSVVRPSGAPVSLLGTSKLRVTIRPARGHTPGGTD